MKLKKLLSFFLIVVMVMGFSACQNDAKKQSLENSKKTLNEINKVQEKSKAVSNLIDQYKKGN